MSHTVRPSAVSGRFYPATAAALAAEVDRHLATASAVPLGGRVRPPKLLLAPHAGYVYSGPIAAQAYALLAPWRGRIARVVLLGPAHRVALPGLAVPGAAAFETPLGRVPIDREALAAVAALPQVVIDDGAHADEHALEVQLPFLQRTLGGFELVPLVVGRARVDEVVEVIERLWGGDETLVLVSSDLSHYLPYAEARARDAATIERVLRLEPALSHDEACGATPLAGALVAARRHRLVPRLLDLRNSGDTAGDRRHVVGYAAVAFEEADDPDVRASGARDEAERDATAAGAGAGVGSADGTLGAALLAHARDAIAAAFGLATQPQPTPPALHEHGATFVTLRHAGALRGCIGTLEARRALHEDVRLHAVAAAFDDPRFVPLTRAEFERIDIEVSVLTRAEPLGVADEAAAHRALRPGVDGVILEWRGRRATFLPQVWEQLPQPAEFLGALKRKAGLAADFWAVDLRLARYTVRKFAAAAAPA